MSLGGCGIISRGPASNSCAISAARQSAASNAPTHDPDSPENKDKKHWIEIQLLDEAGKPVAGEPYKVTLPNGSTVADGTLDDKGWARVPNIDPGTCIVTFPTWITMPGNPNRFMLGRVSV